ncbi:hypothetical protein ZHAS_00019910 [Anopheles sinensis]|uniref:Uncharacterized protein n=1 Tax=Anopheles sinensis TaxID=74873 RepID=A0A084WMB7_ANOSI|nr:hypothetical protein ZHAS_00019910 [Anopheles sinensis]
MCARTESLDSIRAVFGSATLDGEMGPYPLSDHSNLLGPSSKYVGVGLGYAVPSGGYGGHMPANYGTTTAGTVGTTVAISTNCSPMPLRRARASGRGTGAPSHGNASYGYTQGDGYHGGGGDGGGLPVRDSFRRHSAHGRIVCTDTWSDGLVAFVYPWKIPALQEEADNVTNSVDWPYQHRNSLSKV